MGQHDVFEQVQLRLYQAALGEASWADAANLIGEVGQTRGTALAFVTGRGKRDAEVFFTRLCLDGQLRKDLEREYWTRYYPHDESISRIARIPTGELVATGDLWTDREKRTSIAYDARRHTGMQKGLNVRLSGPEGSHIFLSLADSTARGGEWGSDQIETITGILPHVRHFVRVRQSLSDAGALGRSLVGMLGNTRLGIIHLDRNGRIVEVNDQAREILREGDGLLDSGGLLMVRGRSENDAFQRLLQRALHPLGHQAFAGSLTVKRTVATSRLVVQITPVPRTERFTTTRNVAALLTIVDPEAPATIDPRVVGRVLGLTPAESTVAAMLATGHGVQDIAALTKRSVGTVRWHLNRIFSKQQLANQSDLVRRILTLEGLSETDG